MTPHSTSCSALIIGIDEYPNFDASARLQGAVNDANKFDDFVRASFTTFRIKKLLNADASHHRIVESITALASDPKISHGDPIIIFFAGHGSRSPSKIRKDVMFEVLVPSDATCCMVRGREVVSGIPDYDIAEMINRIAAARGNNITLIFDCCHSAGSNRSSPNYRPRSIAGLPPLNDSPAQQAAIKEAALNNRKFMSLSRNRNNESHVLLAACAPMEFAWETRENGVFTSALLKILTEIDFSNRDYISLINHPTLRHLLKGGIHTQTPVCDGANAQRALFQTRVPISSSDSHFIMGREEETRLTLNAGIAQGIDRGVRLQIVKIVNDDFDMLGEVEVEEATATSATLSQIDNQNFNVPNPFHARTAAPSATYKILVYCVEKWRSDLESLLCAAGSTLPGDGISLVSDPYHADLEVIFHQSESQLSYTLRVIADSPLVLMGRSTLRNPAGILQVIRSAARFLFFLRQTCDRSPINNIELEFMKLEFMNLELKPVKNLLEDNTATLVFGRQHRPEPYGMKILNGTPYPIYPHLLVFNGMDLTINQWHLPSETGGKKISEFQIMPKKELTIGYGDRITCPKYFSLAEGENMDITWFKLFATTKPSDFWFLQQNSPFESPPAAPTASPTGPRRFGDPPTREVDDVWSTCTATVFQRLQTLEPGWIPRPKPMPIRPSDTVDNPVKQGMSGTSKPKPASGRVEWESS